MSEKKVWVLLLAVLFVSGCEKEKKAASPVTPPVTQPAGVLTSDAVMDDDMLRDFIKVWHLQVTPDVQMNVTSKVEPWLALNVVAFSDELRQGDGKWVEFDCGAVADKIIVRDLVPKVEVACKSVHQIATDYWKKTGVPMEFTDHEGRVWRRQ